MALSESERRVLDDLEQQLRPSVSTRAVVRLWGATRTKQILAGSAAVSTGLLSVGVGLALTGIARIGLVLFAYLLIVSGVAVLVDCRSRSRRASGAPRPRAGSRQTRYLR